MNILEPGLKSGLKSFARFAVLSALPLLASCGGIGEGSTLQSLKIVMNPVNELVDQGEQADGDDENVTIHQCFCTNLGVLGTFTSGIAANFAQRVQWTSDNPNIRVYDGSGFSSFFLPSDGSGGFYQICASTQRGFGAVYVAAFDGIASGPTDLAASDTETATITASFSGLSDTITVTAKKLGAGAITIELDDPFEVTAAGQAVAAVGTSIDLDTFATIDGRKREVAGSNWTLYSGSTVVDSDSDSSSDTADATSKALIGSAGNVIAQFADGGSALSADTVFGACPAYDIAPHPVRIGEATALALSNDPTLRAGITPPSGITNPLAVGDLNAGRFGSDELLSAVATVDFDGAGSGTDTGEQDVGNFVRVRELCDTYSADCTSGTCVAGAQTGNDTFCSGAEPVCGATTTLTAATECRGQAAQFTTFLLGTNVTALATNTGSGLPSGLVATFDPTPSITTDDPFVTNGSVTNPAGAGHPECPEALCSTSVTITPVEADYQGLSIQAPADGDVPDSTDDPYQTYQYRALGTFEAGYNQYVTRLSATGFLTQWTSSDTDVARVSNSLFTKGLVTPKGCGGTVTIRARSTGSVAASEAFTTDGAASCASDPFCDDVTLMFDPAPIPPASCPTP